MAETMMQWAKERVDDQPTFDTKEEAVQRALEELRRGEICEVWEKPDGKYIACDWVAFEAAFRYGCKQIISAAKLSDELHTDDIDEV